MELVAIGWERNRGENELVKRNLLAAKLGQFDSYSASETYIALQSDNAGEGQSHLHQNESVAIRFNAPIVLNGSYLVRLTLDKREVAQLFFLQHAHCSLEEICHLLSNHNDRQGTLRRLRAAATPQINPILFKPVDELEISIRLANGLKNDGITYIGELVQKSEAELLRGANFGRKSLSEVKEVLAQLGLHLGMEVPGWPNEDLESWAKIFGDTY